MTMVILTFVDESKQRLKFSECEIKASSNPLIGNAISAKQYLQPIVRGIYSAEALVDFIGKEPS